MPGPKPTPPEIRFWRKVEKGRPEECWLWTGGKQGKGYGQFFIAKARPIGAHRYSWMLANGRDIPAGLQVMHSCDNPPCVNPAHLRVGSCRENLRDCAAKGRNPGNRECHPRGGQKVDDAIVRRLRDAGLTLQQIADVFDVSRSTALRSVRRTE